MLPDTSITYINRILFDQLFINNTSCSYHIAICNFSSFKKRAARSNPDIVAYEKTFGGIYSLTFFVKNRMSIAINICVIESMHIVIPDFRICAYNNFMKFSDRKIISYLKNTALSNFYSPKRTENMKSRAVDNQFPVDSQKIFTAITMISHRST